jgi:Leucine-rich repeat (LRR) protein
MTLFLFFFTSLLVVSVSGQLLAADEAALRLIFAEGGGEGWKVEARSTWGSPTVAPCEWRGVTCALGRVVSLDLFEFGLTSLSASVGQLTALKSLLLDRNKLTSLPESLSALAALETLSANSNRLSLLPSSIGALGKLKNFYIQLNELRGIPGSVGALSSLKELYLSNNVIESLPDSVANLTSIDKIYVDSNRLRALPAGIGGLRTLTRLYAYNNQFVNGLPSLAQLTSLRRLFLSNSLLPSLPALPMGSLDRLDANGNQLSGSLNLCGPRLVNLNINSNRGLLDLAAGQVGRCMPALASVNVADCQLASIDFLRDSPLVTDVDVSGNPIGNSIFALARSWSRLQSLRASSVGATLPIADVLASIVNCTSLISLDVAGNPGIGGELHRRAFADAGFYDGVSSASFNLVLLRLDGISATVFQAFAENFFTAVRFLSIRNMTRLTPDVDFTNQQWLHLETMDLRGVNPSLVITNPVAFPGALPSVDLQTQSSCPSALLGGALAKFAITADPKFYNWSLCECLPGRFGEPWRGCLDCPVPRAGEAAVHVDCTSRTGSLVSEGGWIFFDRRLGRVAVKACPSDSQRSPCQISQLPLSIRSLDEWSARASGKLATCTPGYEGRLCSRCSAGYYRSGRLCFRCGSRSWAWVSPVLSVLLLTALGLRTVSGDSESKTGLIRILTLHAQTVSLLPGMSLRLADSASVLMRASSSGAGGLSMDGLECSGRGGWDGFYGPFVLAALLPVLVALGSAWIGLLSGFVGRGKSMRLRSRLDAGFFYLWLVLLFGSMQRLLAPLNCTDYGSSAGRRYMAAALWIPCEGPSYRWLLAWSILLSLLYIVGSAAVLAFRLRPSAKGTSAVSGFLRNPYKVESYYWEGVQLSKRISLAFANSLTPLYSPVQPVIVSSVLVLSMLAHTWRKPYRRGLDNVVESVSLTLLLSSYMAGLIASNPHFGNSSGVVSWFLFSLNGLFLVTVASMVISGHVRRSLFGGGAQDQQAIEMTDVKE